LAILKTEGCEIAFKPFIRNRGEAYLANGVEKSDPYFACAEMRGNL
jgi:hypothetical protein